MVVLEISPFSLATSSTAWEVDTVRLLITELSSATILTVVVEVTETLTKYVVPVALTDEGAADLISVVPLTVTLFNSTSPASPTSMVKSPLIIMFCKTVVVAPLPDKLTLPKTVTVPVPLPRAGP